MKLQLHLYTRAKKQSQKQSATGQNAGMVEQMATMCGGTKMCKHKHHHKQRAQETR